MSNLKLKFKAIVASVKTVFAEHKTEMLIAAAIGFFVGANLFQSAFSGFCPLALILRRLGVQSGAAF